VYFFYTHHGRFFFTRTQGDSGVGFKVEEENSEEEVVQSSVFVIP
jgi:hypothetical protein